LTVSPLETSTPPARFHFAGGDARTTILGATGSGKSTCGLWMLSHQRLDARPWIIFDFKREAIFDAIGFPPIQQLALDGKLPRKPGLYLVSPRPGQDDLVEQFLWRIWEQENIGLYVDEAPLMPDGDAFAAVLQQGRSKRLPVIACTQRPVGVARGLFSEANFVCVYAIIDRRDYKVIEGFVPAEMSAPLPWHHWFWFDRASRTVLHMGPVPHPTEVAGRLAAKAPFIANAWHPFSFTSRPSGREAIQLH
jgi:hypothetical protein